MTVGTSFRIALRRLRASQTASAAVELAIVFPILMLLVVGVMDYARIFSTAITVANAAKAAAQFGSQSTATSSDTAAINQAGRQDGLDAGTIGMTAVRSCRCANGATVNCVTGVCVGYGVPAVYVAVTATKSVPMLLRVPGLPSAIAVSRTATLRVQ